MKNLKNFKQFNEAHVDKYGKLRNMNWEEDLFDEDELIKLARAGFEKGNFVDEETYLMMPLNLQSIYKKISVEDNVVFFNPPYIVEDILEDYPYECKLCIENNILNSKKLPYSFEVIEILPIEYQELIISYIINNFKKYQIEEIQFDSFDLKVQKIINFNKDKIIITWKKQGR
jgi:hypothetical protein